MINHLKVGRTIVELMDNKFQLFGKKFGIDPLIGLFPVVGDILPLVVSSYLIWIAYKLGVKKLDLLKIIGITIVDLLVGFIPLIGDIADFSYKSYVKSLEIIENHIYTTQNQNIIECEKTLTA